MKLEIKVFQMSEKFWIVALPYNQQKTSTEEVIVELTYDLDLQAGFKPQIIDEKFDELPEGMKKNLSELNVFGENTRVAYRFFKQYEEGLMPVVFSDQQPEIIMK